VRESGEELGECRHSLSAVSGKNGLTAQSFRFENSSLLIIIIRRGGTLFFVTLGRRNRVIDE
jgi:hypothetical protein